MSLTLSQEEYESLSTLARAGATTTEAQRQLHVWLTLIEQRNNVTRYGLWVQWQEADSPMPPNTNFPEQWPPEMRYFIQLFSRPINRADVDAVLAKKARRAVTVLVTPDPAGILGWSTPDEYFVR